MAHIVKQREACPDCGTPLLWIGGDNAPGREGVQRAKCVKCNKVHHNIEKEMESLNGIILKHK